MCINFFFFFSAVRGWGKIQAEKPGILPRFWLFSWVRTTWESLRFEVALRYLYQKYSINIFLPSKLRHL